MAMGTSSLSFYLFTSFWLCWVLVGIAAFSLVLARGLLSTSHCCGFSRCEVQALGERASVVAACGLSKLWPRGSHRAQALSLWYTPV